jgi:hypothetical protein
MDTLSKIPDLLGRNFAIGFIVPVFVLFGFLWLCFNSFNKLPKWLRFNPADSFFDAALVVGVVWISALTLLGLNRLIVRTLEGYTFKYTGLYDRLKSWQQSRFIKRAAPSLHLQRMIDEARSKGTTEPGQPDDHAERLRLAVEQFPHSEGAILPTSFGNRYRAIETYPLVVYGLDAIPAWGRLIAVMPEEFKEAIQGTKAQLDFSVNLLFVGVVSALIYFSLAVATISLGSWWLFLLYLATIALGYVLAVSSLGSYGQFVKSAFDLYRKDLADSLGLDLPRSSVHEREMWRDVSRMMIYRSDGACDRLTKYRKRG